MEHKVTETELAAAAVAPRVTLAVLESEIAYVGYFTALEGVNAGGAATMTKHAADALRLLTFAVVVLRNGFTVTGQSACASPENFNAEIGQRLALDDAKRHIWPLLGFRLRDALASVSAPAVVLHWDCVCDWWDAHCASGVYRVQFAYTAFGRRWVAVFFPHETSAALALDPDGYETLEGAQAACLRHLERGLK